MMAKGKKKTPPINQNCSKTSIGKYTEHRANAKTPSVSDFILHMNNFQYPCIQYNEHIMW